MWLNLHMNHHHFGYTGWIVRRPMMHVWYVLARRAIAIAAAEQHQQHQKMRIRRNQVIPGRERTTNEDDGRRGSRLLPRPRQQQQQQQRSSYHYHPQLPQISPSSSHCFCLWGRCHGWSQQGRPLAPLPRTTSQVQHDQFAPAYDLPLRLLLHSRQVCILLATHHHLRCSDLIACASSLFFSLFFLVALSNFFSFFFSFFLFSSYSVFFSLGGCSVFYEFSSPVVVLLPHSLCGNKIPGTDFVFFCFWICLWLFLWLLLQFFILFPFEDFVEWDIGT